MARYSNRPIPIVEVTGPTPEELTSRVICPCCNQEVEMYNGEMEWHKDPTKPITWPCTGSCSSMRSAESHMEIMRKQREKEQSGN